MSASSILIRTDASLDIGTGHVMRCLTLAEALREQGASCRFVCRAHPGNLIDLIRQRGFVVHSLPSDPDWQPRSTEPAHAAWLGADWQADAEQTKVSAGGTAIDWLIVDHYALDGRWESALRGHSGKIMVIDDLADRVHDCDLLLDQNLGRNAEDYAALVPGGCTLLVGAKYALLRPEFSAQREYSLARRSAPQLKHLLITMGGVDKDDVTGKVLDALRVCTLPADCRISVVMGPHAPWLAQVRERAANMPWPTMVLVNISDMARLMADSDLAIGAAGCTSWERCCLGLPSLMMVLADNQR
ncbi:MAG: UDP-2,4-diacetamido-2,4,6-trideoxy-beta-L-altropyranose hydrolase, partial [Pseudomonadota bacterium]